MTNQTQKSEIKAIIGLGNPGKQYTYNRHNIGFRVVDALCAKHGGTWQTKDNMLVAEIVMHDKPLLLIKPQTFMNSSGKVLPFLQKKGIKPENIVVVHDELELPFGTVKERFGGSAKGHNGLKSIIEHCGPDFVRLRVGIGRPAEREDVPDYVLEDFSEGSAEIQKMIDTAITLLEQL
jgi:PTH1 family peptidyl-tRNA hydrolase